MADVNKQDEYTKFLSMHAKDKICPCGVRASKLIEEIILPDDPCQDRSFQLWLCEDCFLYLFTQGKRNPRRVTLFEKR